MSNCLILQFILSKYIQIKYYIKKSFTQIALTPYSELATSCFKTK